MKGSLSLFLIGFKYSNIIPSSVPTKIKLKLLLTHIEWSENPESTVQMGFNYLVSQKTIVWSHPIDIKWSCI